LFLKTDGAGNLSFDSLSFSTPLAVIGNATSGSEIRLPEDTDNGSNYVAIKAPDTIASNLTLTLPSADGTSGQVLQTNGSGVLSFAGVSGGKVLQVIEASDGTSRNTTSTSYVTASNTLSVSITPSSASNKVLIFANINYTFNGVGRVDFTVFRDATNLAPVNGFVANHSGSVEMPVSFMFLDSPSSTSALTYQVYIKVSAGTGYINATNFLSTIHCLEIKG